MAALSANRVIPNVAQAYAAGTGVILDMQVGALEEIYQGSFVSLDAGDAYAAPLAAGEVCVGVSLDRVTGGSSNGDNTCRVLTGGIVQHALASVAQADIGKYCYASDDNTLSLTSTSNSPFGRIINVPATGTAVVRMRWVGDKAVGTQAGA